MSISLLHPSRSRLQKSIATTQKWMSQIGGCEVQLIVSIDEDDPQNAEYQSYYAGIGATILINPNKSAVDAINSAAKISRGDILLILSDDTDCPRNWAEQIIYEMHDKEDRVLRVSDHANGQGQDWIVTMPVVHRKYYDRFGYIYYPGYRHMFCDTEFTHVATCLKKVSKCSLEFPHLHYSKKGLNIRADEINHRADATWNEGKALYIERFKRNFDLPINAWDINSESHLKWLKANVR